MINFHLMGHWRAGRLDQKMNLVWPYPTNTNLMDITFDLQWRGVKVELRAENDLITSQLYCKLSYQIIIIYVCANLNLGEGVVLVLRLQIRMEFSHTYQLLSSFPLRPLRLSFHCMFFSCQR